MTPSDYITIVATGITILCTIVSVIFATRARTFSEAAGKARDAAQMNAVIDRLKSAQDHIREFAPEKLGKRGFDPEKQIDSIRKEFDTALNTLPETGVTSKVRGQIADAQASFNTYGKSFDGNVDRVAWERLQSQLQNAISELSRLFWKNSHDNR